MSRARYGSIRILLLSAVVGRTAPGRRLLPYGCILFFVAFVVAAAPVAAGQVSVGRGQKFDAGWLFTRGDPAGAEKINFADSAWRQLDLPHDWSIEGPIAQNNPSGPRDGFFPTGAGWYRKHFTLDAAAAGKYVFIQFDGVMANSDVYINGFHVGHRPYGWVTFQYNLTGHVTFGPDKPNVIAVRVDDSNQPSSRYYEGAGIYRHVWIGVVDPLHLAEGGVYVTTPSITADRADVDIKTTIDNQTAADKNVTVHVRLARFGKAKDALAKDAPEVVASPVTATIGAGKTAEIKTSCSIGNPSLWDGDHPSLYQATVEVDCDGKTIDSQVVPFGIREAVFKADSGFWLNKRNFKLLGVCVHSEGGAFGAAVPDSVWERRLAILKSLGVNAIRTAHNPPSPDFLDICDRMGLLVMDEMFDVWTVGKYSDQDYHLHFRDWWQRDVTDTVLRDRNHPSIVIYSAGNEIHDNLASPQGLAQFTKMRDVFHTLDPSRPVTMGILQPVQHRIFTSGFSDLMDVVGVNYRESELLAAHRAHPNYKILGTENTHAAAVWSALRDNPAYAGQFLWTGIDYLGEAGAWPRIGAGAGLIDRNGRIKPAGYLRKSWWSQTPMVYIARGGADRRGGARAGRGEGSDSGNVEVYSNCQSVELFLDGRSLGSKTKPADDSPRSWAVAGSAGTLRAVGSNDGKSVASFELRSAGPAVKLSLSTEKAILPHDYDDVAAVAVMITDRDGNRVVGADPLVTFELAGPGKIAAVDNGAPDNHESFQGSQIHAAAGQCFVWIRATADAGAITLTAHTAGLKDGTITLTAQPAKLVPKQANVSEFVGQFSAGA